MRKESTDTVLSLEWDSLEDFVASATKSEITAFEYDEEDGYGNKPQSRTEKPTDRWDFKLGFDGAVAMSRTGWDEGKVRVNTMARRMRKEVIQANEELFRQKKKKPDVHGKRPRVEAFIRGEPRTMVRKKRQRMETPVVKIVANIVARYDVNSETMATRGAAIAALVELLEMTGRRCEVWAVHCVRGSYRGDASRVLDARFLVKEASTALLMPKLAFALAHPATDRRLAFAITERELTRAEGEEFGSGGDYGTVADVVEEKSRGDVYAPGLQSRMTETEALEWIKVQLRVQGLDIQ